MARMWGRSRGLQLGLIALLLAACGGKRVSPATPVAPPAPAVIVLLPDPDTQVTGRIVVHNEFGSIDVSSARGSLRTTPGTAPGPVTTMSAEDVTRLFGEALAALPPAPRHFTL